MAPVRPVRSLLVWRADDGSGDTEQDIVAVVIGRLRRQNAGDGSRELSLAIQRLEEGTHWLEAHERKRSA